MRTYLIEDYIPIVAISAASALEKSLWRKHPSTLHGWWARRPLVACRATVYAALTPAKGFQSSDDNQQSRLAESAKFVQRLSQYPGDSAIMAEAEQHIIESHAERLSEESGKTVTVNEIKEGHAPRPRVLDMFAGGGAIPLEALRLGCESYALDLNPVAHIIQLCTLVYPQKYFAANKLSHGSAKDKTWAGLVEEVRYWGQWLLERVNNNIGDLYPTAPDPKARPQELLIEAQPKLYEDDVKQPKLVARGDLLNPVAYLWTRTVKCKNPSCEAMVPLVRQTWLCKKKDRYVALKIVAPHGNKYARFELVEAATEDALGFDPAGFSRGGNAACPFCGTVVDIDYVKNEGWAGRIGYQPMALVASRPGARGKVYLSADQLSVFALNESISTRIRELCESADLTIPDERIAGLPDTSSENSLGITVRPYGLRHWADLFTDRQMLMLLTFSAATREAHQRMIEQGYDEGCAKAVATYLATAIDRQAENSSILCRWNAIAEKMQGTFGRQALPMVWDFCETSPFGGSVGDWVSIINLQANGIEGAAMFCNFPGNVYRGSATNLPWSDGFFDAVITDPPYYDNVPYADISDFFYVWLKRTIGHLYPEHFATEGTPKKKEAVANSIRYGGDKEKAKQAYEGMMAKAFAEAQRVLKPGGLMTVVYAHKTMLGWTTLVNALRESGFTVTEAWPLDTEMKTRMRGMESAALASSIFLIARKREGAETGHYETNVRPDLERIVRERVKTLWSMGISGADLVIAAVGAGLRAFTRFARVEYANGEEMPAERFLTEVEGVVLETLLEKIFGFSRSGVAAVDGPSRFYVLWRYAYKAAELDSGEAIVFAYPQSVELDGPRGLTQGKSALVEKKKNKYRLRDFTERGEREDLGLLDEDDRGGMTPPLIDVLHRVLWLVENRPRLLSAYLEQAHPDRERLRQVAQALAGPALKGGEADAMLINTTTAEASALGKLLANWRTLIDARLEEFQLR